MESIQIVLEKRTCIAGGAVSGEVILNFPLMQQEQIDEVYLKFKGSVYTFISPARTDLNETKDVDIIRDRIAVWSRGSAYPPPDSHTLSVPFTFNFPPEIPPSFEFTVLESRAVVRYGVEAVGARPGALRLNKRVFVPVVGLPADPYGAQLRAGPLAGPASGWTGPWTTVVMQKNIRTGFWGEYAEVSVEFRYPTLMSVPIWTPIPFTLTVVTTSKTCKRTSDSESGPIWPAPPTKPEDVRLELVRTAYVRTGHLTWTQKDRIALLGRLGEHKKGEDIRVQTAQKAWLPNSETKGRWKQQTSFTSSLDLSCSPSFKSPTLSVEYALAIVAPFSGMNNTAQLDIPISISSGVIPRLYTNSAGGDTAPPLYDSSAEPQPTLELPPYVILAAQLSRSAIYSWYFN
ncbi:hypothetical protein FOMPIDRAFT_1031598 [Fomitopsis schrenkii]|uniref:Arrestin-like N-terminal domain-containing protein n=1 Tax=Fomitopsis schrenkii TaxID=2126942 RepID=S8E4M0_FOMSC|nr:hypothetical protein FOMPIDRAFT_1031598 [Fomitopsis schrenkii]